MNNLTAKYHIQNRQRKLDKKYNEEGLTDEVLEEQLELNRLRNEYDVNTDDEKVYEEYVQ